MNIREYIQIKGEGTSEGAEKGWETRRGGGGDHASPSDKFDNVKVKGGKLAVSRTNVRNSQGDAAPGVRYQLTVQPSDRHLAKETTVLRVHKEGDTHVVSDNENIVWHEHDDEDSALKDVHKQLGDFVKDVKKSSARVGGY